MGGVGHNWLRLVADCAFALRLAAESNSDSKTLYVMNVGICDFEDMLDCLFSSTGRAERAGGR